MLILITVMQFLFLNTVNIYCKKAWQYNNYDLQIKLLLFIFLLLYTIIRIFFTEINLIQIWRKMYLRSLNYTMQK